MAITERTRVILRKMTRADLRRVRFTLADALKRCRKCKKGCDIVADLKRKRGKRRPK